MSSIEETMKNCHDLVNETWLMAKDYFILKPQTADDYHDLTTAANERLKAIGNKYGYTSKEYSLARRMFVAINEYTDADWRERNMGVQINLWKNQ